MDLGDQKVSASIFLDGKYPGAVAADGSRFQEAKCCTDCRTTKTPLWRGGPSGPKSLCNACGIRYRKRRRELLGMEGREKGKREKKTGSKVGVLRLLGLGRGVPLNRGNLLRLKQRWLWRRLREEEKAALLLMALSSGLIDA